MDTKKTTLQKNLAFIRAFKKLTYRELGERVGVNEAQAKSYELRSVVPGIDVLCNIADMVGITLDVLLRQEITESSIYSFQEPQIDYTKSLVIQNRIRFVVQIMLRERTFGKYTQAELQRVLQIPAAQFGKLMAGEDYIFTVESMILLVQKFGVNANWLLTGSGSSFNDADLAQAFHKLKERMDLLENAITAKGSKVK